MKISIDFETTSPVDLARCGVHVYAKHPHTEVLCCAYSVDGGPVRLWFKGDEIPSEFYVEDAHFYAWNAQFERTIWRDTLHWPHVPLDKWHCTLASAASKGLPLHLADAARALRSPIQKDLEGHALMKRVSKMPSENISKEDLNRLAEYCARDVMTEQQIEKTIGPLTGNEYEVWQLDQQINDRGLGIDRNLISFLRDITSHEKARLESRLYELTEGQITSLHQHIGIKKWLANRGIDIESMRADSLRDLHIDDEVAQEVLQLRLEGAKSSLAKLDSMQAYDSGRLRGLFQYHGASTGRWAGRGVQLQNFPRSVPDPPVDSVVWLPRDLALAEIRGKGGVMHWASSALRSCIVPAEGSSLYVADYSQIETRILAWIADDVSMMKVFEDGKDPYVVFASAMYKVPIEEVTKQQRQIAKSAVLGLGYSMGAQKYQDYASNYGANLSIQEAERIVQFYRNCHAPIAAFWRNVERAAAKASYHGQAQKAGKVWFYPRGTNLICRLPSGREITYWDVQVDVNEWMVSMTYMKRDGITGEWVRRKLYGGLITENIVQGIARDVLVHGMMAVESEGFHVVGTVHDEILAEANPDRIDRFNEALNSRPNWLGISTPFESKEGKRWSK